MDRIDSTQKVFDDLRRRVAALPRLRHKAMQEELSDVTTIINQIERAFLTHLLLIRREDMRVYGKTIESSEHQRRHSSKSPQSKQTCRFTQSTYLRSTRRSN